MEVYFGWVGVGRHFLWVSESRWGSVETYLGSVGVKGDEWGLVGVVTRFSINQKNVTCKPAIKGQSEIYK